MLVNVNNSSNKEVWRLFVRSHSIRTKFFSAYNSVKTDRMDGFFSSDVVGQTETGIDAEIPFLPYVVNEKFLTGYLSSPLGKPEVVKAVYAGRLQNTSRPLNGWGLKG